MEDKLGKGLTAGKVASNVQKKLTRAQEKVREYIIFLLCKKSQAIIAYFIVSLVLNRFCLFLMLCVIMMDAGKRSVDSRVNLSRLHRCLSVSRSLFLTLGHVFEILRHYTVI